MPVSALWRRVSADAPHARAGDLALGRVAFVATISSGTYAVVTSISVIGLYISYIIPVYLAWRAQRLGDGGRARAVASRTIRIGDQRHRDALGRLHHGDPGDPRRHARGEDHAPA